jgi:hypothetical protein
LVEVKVERKELMKVYCVVSKSVGKSVYDLADWSEDMKAGRLDVWKGVSLVVLTDNLWVEKLETNWGNSLVSLTVEK